MDFKLYTIVCICNDGYSNEIMELAKEYGAKGGTVIQGNGSASEEAMKLYGLGIHPEKEIVLILVRDKIVENILSHLYDKYGINSSAAGIYFTLPVTHASDNVINQYKTKKHDEE